MLRTVTRALVRIRHGLTLCVLALLLPMDSAALRIESVRVLSELDEPLNASVSLQDVSPGEVGEISVSIRADSSISHPDLPDPMPIPPLEIETQAGSNTLLVRSLGPIPGFGLKRIAFVMTITTRSTWATHVFAVSREQDNLAKPAPPIPLEAPSPLTKPFLLTDAPSDPYTASSVSSDSSGDSPLAMESLQSGERPTAPPMTQPIPAPAPQKPSYARPSPPASIPGVGSGPGQVERVIVELLDNATTPSPNPRVVTQTSKVDIEQMPTASVAFNAPDAAHIDDLFAIHLVLSSSHTVAAAKGLIAEPGKRVGQTVRVSDRMRARVQGAAFEITPLTPEIQVFSSQTVTEWRWEARALRPGAQSLYVTLDALYQAGNDRSEYSVQTFRHHVQVAVNPWPARAALGAGAAGIGGVLWWTSVALRRLRTRRRARHRSQVHSTAVGPVSEAVPDAAANRRAVFLSYSSKDAESAQRIAQALGERGIEVWKDDHSIAAATRWSEQIVNGIDNAFALVLLGSTHALNSDNVSREVQLAMDKRRTIVPVFLEDCFVPPSFQYALAGLQILYLEDAEDVAGMTALEEVLNALRTGAPLPGNVS